MKTKWCTVVVEHERLGVKLERDVDITNHARKRIASALKELLSYFDEEDVTNHVKMYVITED